MSQDGNTYQGLPPDRKLELFVFEAERFMTSIIGYSKLLAADAYKPPLQDVLSPEFAQALGAIQQAGSRFAGLLRDVTTPDDTNPYRDALLRQAIIMLINESTRSLSIIIGYNHLLEMEANRLADQPEVPPKFLENLRMLHTAASRLSKTREELAASMK